MTEIVKCNYCEHIRENKGFRMTCEAFPDGIPFEFDCNKVAESKECNNGLKYKKKNK